MMERVLVCARHDGRPLRRPKGGVGSAARNRPWGLHDAPRGHEPAQVPERSEGHGHNAGYVNPEGARRGHRGGLFEVNASEGLMNRSIIRGPRKGRDGREFERAPPARLLPASPCLRRMRKTRRRLGGRSPVRLEAPKERRFGAAVP